MGLPVSAARPNCRSRLVWAWPCPIDFDGEFRVPRVALTISTQHQIFASLLERRNIELGDVGSFGSRHLVAEDETVSAPSATDRYFLCPLRFLSTGTCHCDDREIPMHRGKTRRQRKSCQHAPAGTLGTIRWTRRLARNHDLARGGRIMDWLIAVMFGLAGPPASGDYISMPPPVVDRGANVAEKNMARRQHRDHRYEPRSAIAASKTAPPRVGYAATAPTPRTGPPSRLVPGTPLLGQDPRKPLSWWLFSAPLPKELSAGK